MTYGKRLKEVRKYLNMTQENFAKALNIKNKQTISDTENDKQQKLGQEPELILENKYKINLKWVKTGEGEMINNSEIIAGEVNETPIPYGKECENMVTVPYHKEVYASAGGGSDATSMVDTNPIIFSKMFLNSYLGVYDLQGLSMINAAGDSMDPTIKSGAIMFVYPMESEGFKDGSIYVLMCGDALLVKRVSLDPVTKVYTLLSDNGKVNPIELTIDEASECRFVGRVVGHLDRV